MSYRYFPWTRRGLAAEVTGADTLGDTIASRAGFGVRVRLNTGTAPQVALRIYGPGDVIGIDPRVIVRVEPKRLAHDAEPDKLAAIEFDPPDFPWMFTPAAPGGQDRLRPWCALIVVEQQDGVRVEIVRDRPLPRLVIEPPAVPGDELPDLAESWAWAHAQVLDDGAHGSVRQLLEGRADLNVSRVLCPRRMESGRRYLACLVPAFEAGRLAGLGQPVPDADTTGPAWRSGASAPASVQLPVYFHWEFATGPAGDFESLARRLVPRPVPDRVGTRPVFLGDADPALPRLDPSDPGAVLGLEGALRAPLPGAGSSVDDVPAGLRSALETVLEAPSRHVAEGADRDAEAVAPPLYGQWHVRQHEIPADRPRWFRELNLDPRQRANAGLGGDVVRANQEEYMDAAWRQVDEILAANRLLNLARLARELAARVHTRHIAALDAAGLFELTAPIHTRLPFEDTTAHALLQRSVLPPGATDPSFRRMTSRQSAVLKRAARLADAPIADGGSVDVQIVSELAGAERALDPVAGVPDGLTTSRLLDQVDVTGLPDDAPVELLPGLAEVEVGTIRKAREARTKLAETPPIAVKVRPDIALSGIVVDAHIARLPRGDVIRPPVVVINEVIGTALTDRDAAGFVIPADPRTTAVELVSIDAAGTILLRSATGERAVGRVAPELLRRLDRPQLGEVIGSVPAGTFDVAPGAPPLTDVTIDVDGTLVRPIEPLPIPFPAPTLPPLVRDRDVIERFVTAFDVQVKAMHELEASIVPAPRSLDLAELKALVVAATEPSGMIAARVTSRLKIGDAPLVHGLSELVRVGEDLDPILAFPTFERAVYADLARLDEDRLLPGIGRIPADTLTLLETNPRFVEAFLIGMNHEFNRELLWREYPTDRRGTPFRHFWDRLDGAPDIAPIHRFDRNRRLGSNSLGDIGGSLVLLVRGDLLRRFPNAVVYATPSGPNDRLPDPPGPIKEPVFDGQLGADVTFVGFDLTVEDVTPEPGWLFVIQEQPTEPRFGLDVPAASGDPSLNQWNDLTWGHAGVSPGGHLRIASTPINGRDLPLVTGEPLKAKFAFNSAHVAAITFQRPFRAAIHSRRLLKGVKG